MDRRRRFEGCPLTRRGFMAGCAAGLGSLAFAAEEPQAKPRIRLVFTHVPASRPTWPNVGYDYEARKKELTARLRAACPGIEFLPATVMNRGQANKLLQQDKTQNIDGYLVYMLGLWTGAPQTIASASGKPTLFVDDLYGGSGEFLIAYAAARRRGWKAEGISSSNFDDVATAVRCFEVLKKPGGSPEAFLAAVRKSRIERTKPSGDLACKEDKVEAMPIGRCLEELKKKKILTVGGGWGMPRSGKAVEQVLGIKVVRVEFRELHDAYLKADREQAAQWADRWIKAAEKVIEPSRDEIVKSGAMYLGMLELLKRHDAQAITINCLGGFYGGHLKAYPCLGFCQLNDDGLVGGCESDIRSAATMVAISTLVGRPGYISDPVIDTSRKHIIYAHCVAPTKVFGPDGPRNPYHIRNHSEDRKGASMRSLLPLGYMTTTLEIEATRREIVIHQGKSVENVDEDKACRTKLAALVKGDMEKLLGHWDRWGWHRVTFFGDIREPVLELAKALNCKVTEEA